MRTASLIKRTRAALSHEQVNSFFDHYTRTAEGIDPDVIYNYDETNLRDDAGAVKAIFRRGVKYAEQVRDSTKSSISVMFCCTASGRMLPPYVLYKGSNCYPSWGKGGPKGTAYTSTASGWMDMVCFEDWFIKILLPDAKRRPGIKLIIGDNLASHINPNVISLCRENDIQFVCLPPNSTDKMQPLDVGYFSQMKQAWRQMLRRITDADPTAKVLKKTEFPGLLKELLESLKPGQHLPKAFEKCGLYPINRDKVLDRIPTVLNRQEIASHMDHLVLKKLEVRRFGDQKKKTVRGKKIPAGQSFTQEDSSSQEEEDASSSEEEGDKDEVEEMGEGEDVDQDMGQEDSDEEDSDAHFRAGSLVAALYEGEWFIAEVCMNQDRVPVDYVRLSYMAIKGVNSFSWPDKKDLVITYKDDVLLEDVLVEPVNSRGNVGLKKIDHDKILSLMVLVFLLFLKLPLLQILS